MGSDTPRSTNFRSNRDTLVRCPNCGSFIDSISSAVIVWRVILDDGRTLYTDHRIVHDSTQCKNNVFRNDHFLWKLVSSSFQNGKLDFDRLFDRKRSDKFHQIDENSIKMIMPLLHLLLQRWSFRQERLDAIRIAAEKATEEKAREEKAAAEKRAVQEKAREDKIAAEKTTRRRVTEEKAKAEKIAAEKAREERLAAEKVAAKRIAVMKILARKASEEAAEEATKSHQGKPRAGYVYLLQSPTGYYKIGRTKNPSNRIKTFSVKLPFEVEFIVIIATSDMVQLETELHHKYASKRIDGEWFELAPADVAYMKGLAI